MFVYGVVTLRLCFIDRDYDYNNVQVYNQKLKPLPKSVKYYAVMFNTPFTSNNIRHKSTGTSHSFV